MNSNDSSINKNKAIGIFDSGIGGLTVVSRITQLMPNEDIIYLGDIARLPYGSKTEVTIKQFAQQTVKFLLKQQVKAIVIACNTIAANAKAEIMQLAGTIPIIDVVSAGVQAVLEHTQGRRIGIIATNATINSNAYPKIIQQLQLTQQRSNTERQNIQIIAAACPLFVPFIEENLLQHEALESIARHYLSPLIAQNIDTLVLACTHYPIITPLLKKIIGNDIHIIDPAIATSKALAKILHQHNLINDNITHCAKERYCLTERSSTFQVVYQLLLGKTIIAEPELVTIDCL